MKFKDLKQGFSLHVLNKESIEFSSEKVTNVSLPHIDAKLSATGMVVDITTDKSTYCMIAESEVAYPYNKVISTDKECILREVEAMRATCQQRINNIHRDEQTVSKCNQLIAELDPVQKEKQANEARFAQIEKNQADIMAMLKKLTD